MSLDLLFPHFETLIRTPEDVARLNQAILALAVQGKLVPQDPADEPASELLKRIRAEKRRLVKEGKLRTEKPLPKVESSDVPHELPEDWEWVRMATISKYIQYGYTASADFSVGGCRLLRITDIQNDRVDWERVPGCAIEQIEMQKYLLQDNDILIARTGGTVGKSYLIQEPKLAAVFASYLIRIAPPPGVEAHYLKLFLGSPLYWGQLNAQSKGTGQPNVNGVSLGNLLVPLPPLAEQRRIVAKVESLFAQTRALEVKLRQARDDLVTVN
ncbi:MAG: restriction endonuclease subunit S, partial [Anaerolineae bacterium]